jgi:hypothetical protein
MEVGYRKGIAAHPYDRQVSLGGAPVSRLRASRGDCLALFACCMHVFHEEGGVCARCRGELALC